MAEHGSKDIEMGSKSPGGQGESVVPKADFDGETEVKGEAPYCRGRKRACAWCCAISCCLLVLLVIVVVILAFTVFKPKNPQITVQRITLEGFNLNFQLTFPPELSINLTLGMVISVKNPNKVRFRYSNSTASLLYRGEEVGVVPIPSGAIGPDGTEEISTSLTLLADRLIKDGHLIQDLLSGTLPFSTTTNISGRVTILKIIRHHVKVRTQCDILISIKGSLTTSVCKYDVQV